MRLGIDVGGTNTDAVLMNGRRVVEALKTPTTSDVSSGIRVVLREILASSMVDPRAIRAVMIGTTHFTKPVVEARQMARTAAIRLGAPATRSVPPMTDWPGRLRHALGGHVYVCNGGHEFDGREISALDVHELRRIATEIGDAGVASVAITSVFSPVNGENGSRRRPRYSLTNSQGCRFPSLGRSGASVCWSGRTQPSSRFAPSPCRPGVQWVR